MATASYNRADVDKVEVATNEALASRAVPGTFAHWTLVAVLLATTSIAAAHRLEAFGAAAWMVAIGAGRIAIARSLSSLRRAEPARWRIAFGVGLALSSATWGFGGAGLVLAAGAHQDSWLVLMCLAGVSAAGLTSLCPDRALLRLHIGLMLLPTFAADFLMPGGVRAVVGFALVIAAYGAFLWIQGGYAHETFHTALVNLELLEHQATELDAARQESIEASRVKSEFLANMSHEIRTPMTAVIGYADLLLDPSLSPSDRVNHLQTIRRNGEHLMTVINDILDVSKIEAGKMTVESIPMSVSQVIVDVASSMRVRAVAKNLGFEIRYLGGIPDTIVSDPTRLKQIVMNFVSNAIKFTETGTVRILVRCEGPASPDPKLVVDVADTGVGMTEAQMRLLFQRFCQADASTTRKYGGSGLGLLISKRLAVMLGGDIDVESALGRGSVFRVTIPTGPLAGVSMIEGLTEGGLSEPAARSTPRLPSLPPSCRVLLAEDGHDNQVLVTTYLVKAGAKVKVVADGHQAVEEATRAAAAGAPYDVILMDMQMPELDGYGATSKLRLMKYSGPIVALTAHAMAGDRERCEKAGCDDYLTKPVDRAQLVSLVARYMGSAAPSAGLVSTLVGEADMEEIVHQFVKDLPHRSSAILRASKAEDIETVRRLAHQLKGAGGGYGFPSITEAAAAVELAISGGAPPPVLRTQVEALAGLCRRARAA